MLIIQTFELHLKITCYHKYTIKICNIPLYDKDFGENKKDNNNFVALGNLVL